MSGIESTILDFQGDFEPTFTNKSVTKLEQLISKLTKIKNAYVNQEETVSDEVEGWSKFLLDELPKAEELRKLNSIFNLAIHVKSKNKIVSSKKQTGRKLIVSRKSGNAKTSKATITGKIQKNVLFVLSNSQFKDIDFDDFPENAENEHIKLNFYYIRSTIAEKLFNKFPRRLASDIIISFDPYLRKAPVQSLVFVKKEEHEYQVFKLGENSGFDSYLTKGIGSINYKTPTYNEKKIILQSLRLSSNSYSKTPEKWIEAYNFSTLKEERESYYKFMDFNSYVSYLQAKVEGNNIEALIKKNKLKSQQVHALGEVQKTHLPFIASAKQALIASDITIIASSKRNDIAGYDTKGDWRHSSTPSLEFICATETNEVNLEL
ncbi:hypothetical protein RT41_GL000898 [Lactococcus fujiensis JCM 16395]|uniref:Uncharacterized protein n=1 Tax=Lactococcus fujiensis JCM 16395 TaxID=1291764 RepID=A0A2A5RI92_9LACT|nr:hypothetical protein RT41_GL000898 [Lactococcus fujiensis JCM 16395]